MLSLPAVVPTPIDRYDGVGHGNSIHTALVTDRRCDLVGRDKSRAEFPWGTRESSARRGPDMALGEPNRRAREPHQPPS